MAVCEASSYFTGPLSPPGVVQGLVFSLQYSVHVMKPEASYPAVPKQAAARHGTDGAATRDGPGADRVRVMSDGPTRSGSSNRCYGPQVVNDIDIYIYIYTLGFQMRCLLRHFITYDV